MIKQVIHSNFQSQLAVFMFFLICNTFLLVVISMLAGNVAETPETMESLMVVGAWLTVIYLVSGGWALSRYGRERRGRLFAQLPLSSQEIRVAYWCLVVVCLLISAVFMGLCILIIGNTNMGDILFYSILFLAHSLCVIAVVTLIISYSRNLFSGIFHVNKLLYFFFQGLLLLFEMVCLGMVVAGYVYLTEGGSVNWSVLLLVLMLVGGGLIILDINLFRRADDYLS